MVAEGELKSNVDDSDRVKDLQDEVAYLKAEVIKNRPFTQIKNNRSRHSFIHGPKKAQTINAHVVTFSS